MAWAYSETAIEKARSRSASAQSSNWGAPLMKNPLRKPRAREWEILSE